MGQFEPVNGKLEGVGEMAEVVRVKEDAIHNAADLQFKNPVAGGL